MSINNTIFPFECKAWAYASCGAKGSLALTLIAACCLCCDQHAAASVSQLPYYGLDLKIIFIKSMTV
jgi:hypothetical protein